MVCPFCLHDIAPTWQPMFSTTDELGRSRQIPERALISNRGKERITVKVEWLICPNLDCRQVVGQVSRQYFAPYIDPKETEETWIALPKKGALPKIDPLMPAPMRQDYIEAWRILEDSPRMSSVLSRRILADLLKNYAGKTQYGLKQQIDAFVEDSQHPSRIRENLHYLREMGDFSAHTQQEQTQPEEARPVIDVTPREAEWTLKSHR